MIPFFSPVSNCYGVALATTSSNVTIANASVTPSTVVEITNSTGNLAFVKFSTAPIGNIDHPTAGTGNSYASYPVRTGETKYINPVLGFHQGNVVVSTISPGGTGTIYVTIGATL
jgi:hypothetical protein